MRINDRSRAALACHASLGLISPDFRARPPLSFADPAQLQIQDPLKRLPDKTQAARMLGISLKTLNNKLAEYRGEKG
jgi:Bacterial regulatory protein, Fis family